jgi:hypothetical protein
MNIILHVVLYECKNWFLALQEEQRLRVFELRVLRISGPERNEIEEVGGNCTVRSFVTCALRQIYS